MTNNKLLSKDESVYLNLQDLYESYGYQKFHMQKFEEYSFYLDFKKFLSSEYVLTFPDQSGKLLALRPDVTLSIVKNTKASDTLSEKLYYRENVYRLNKASGAFAEIGQVGVENIGHFDLYEIAEILSMALSSLSAIEDSYVLALSHMGFVTGLMNGLSVESQSEKDQFLSCLKAKNAHDLYRLLLSAGNSEEISRKVSELVLYTGDYAGTLEKAREIVLNDQMREALEEMSAVRELLDGAGNHLILDFSVLSDVDYYNGIIMQGYVRACPKAILSGGRYDLLLDKFNKPLGAMGFAVCLADLNSAYPEKSDVDFDVLLLYSEKSSPAAVMKKAEELRKAGKSVRIAREAHPDLRPGEIIRVEDRVC